MRRRLIIALTAIAFAVAGIATLRGPQSGGPFKARQIVLITIDTLRADRLGVYGYTARPSSPTIDAWAASAVVFDRVTSPAPWTVPSLAGLMTGRHPAEVGAYTNFDGIHGDAETLAEILRRNGYATGNFNTHALLVNEHGGFRQGFDTVVPNSITPELEGEHKAPFAPTEPRLKEWLTAHREQPFFAWIHDMSPHLPPTEGNPYLGSERWTRYDAEVRFMDELIGRLFVMLDQLGFRDDLLVILTADHGEAFGDEHGLIGHQDVMYDEVLRIPLIMKYRGIGQPRRIDEPVQLIDVFPTILALAGLPLPPGLRSESLVPLIDGTRATRSSPLAFHARYFFEDGTHWLAVRDRDWKLLARTHELGNIHERHAPRWQLDEEDGTYYELYRIGEDRAEQRDLYEQQPGEVARLSKLLADWGAGQDDGPRRPEIDEATREKLRALGYE